MLSNQTNRVYVPDLWSALWLPGVNPYVLPWAITLSAGPTVLLYPDGRAHIHFGCGNNVETVKEIAALLLRQFGAQWMPEATFKSTFHETDVRIRPGSLGLAAKAMQQGGGFTIARSM